MFAPITDKPMTSRFPQPAPPPDRRSVEAYQVVCVCGGYGFPLGNASASRIATVGKTLQTTGVPFSLLHCGPSPDPINTNRSGVYAGIPFQYTTTVTRPRNIIARAFVYLRALAGLAVRLVRLRKDRSNTLVYLYIGDGPMNLLVGSICRLIGLPVVQELCEWILGEPGCSRFNRWLYKGAIFEQATGALVISKAIEGRVRELRPRVNPKLLIHRLPAIVDARRFAAIPERQCPQPPATPEFVYCGTWLKDVFFLLRTFRLIRDKGFHCRLKLVGGWAPDKEQAIRTYLTEQGLAPDDVVMMGYVDDATLEECYRNATALLAPLWDDDRSKTRLPNKLAEYLASGRPVVTCRVGDLTDFLTAGENVYLAEPGDAQNMADRMIDVLRDPERASRVGAAGQEVCLSYLDYRAHARTLADFFSNCVRSKR
jgi:glycosyltransferase involved in cell wall biosynthesis